MVHLITTGFISKATDLEWSFIFKTLDAGAYALQSVTHGDNNGSDEVVNAWVEHFNRSELDRAIHSDNDPEEAFHLVTHQFTADWANAQRVHKSAKPAGPIRNRHMLRTTVNKYGVENVIVLAFCDFPLEQSPAASNVLTIADSYGIKTHLFRTDQEKQEF